MLSAALPALSWAPWPVLAVAGTGFLLGCRHGMDWDHVAAITDLTTAAPGGRRTGGLGLAVWYCLGHGLVIGLLGAAVAVLGLDLPPGLDRVFESLVGGTLVVLGAVVLWQLGRDRAAYRYAGRVRLVVGTVRRAWARARRNGQGPVEALDDLGRGTAFGVGVLHGTGAETPTQVVLFASAGAAGSRAGAVVVLLSFLVGLVLSDVGIAAAWLSGLLGVRRVPAVQVALGVLTGLSSLAVGTLFLGGRAAVLPALFGG